MPAKTLTGRVHADCIRRLDLPRLQPALLVQLRGLEDLTGTLSDAMDDLGLFAAVPASILRPSLPGQRVVGQAVTARNAERSDTVTAAAASKPAGWRARGVQSRRARRCGGHRRLARRVQYGWPIRQCGTRSGCAGAVIDGSHRDPQASAACGFPIWSRGVTPITGKWRLQTVEINGRVRIAGITVDAGDLVAADEAGLVFVPFDRVAEVVPRAMAIDAGDARQKQDIASGISLSDLAATQYK